MSRNSLTQGPEATQTRSGTSIYQVGRMGLGRVLITVGLVLLVAGGIVLLLGGRGMQIGRLPGDMSYRGRNFSVFFPLGTSLILSVLVSLFSYLLSRFRQ